MEVVVVGMVVPLVDMVAEVDMVAHQVDMVAHQVDTVAHQVDMVVGLDTVVEEEEDMEVEDTEEHKAAEEETECQTLEGHSKKSITIWQQWQHSKKTFMSNHQPSQNKHHKKQWNSERNIKWLLPEKSYRNH